MLRPIETKYTTIIFSKPKNWDEAKGNCIGLPVCTEDGINYSWWKPTFFERVKVLFGFNIRLAIVGSQPPVSLEIENTKERQPDVREGKR